jgi:hypothetical protein
MKLSVEIPEPSVSAVASSAGGRKLDRDEIDRIAERAEHFASGQTRDDIFLLVHHWKQDHA